LTGVNRKHRWNEYCTDKRRKLILYQQNSARGITVQEIPDVTQNEQAKTGEFC
jgi:hypothetical protein